MAEQLAPHALTTVARVKNRLTITASTHDTVLLRLISAATDHIESLCQRRFKRAAYTNEVHSVRGNALYIATRNAPINSVSTVEYSVGLPSSKNWTALTADDWEVCEDGKSGLVKIYGVMPRGVNRMRITYNAGYDIDFANAGEATHTLPFDLSDLCERMTVKLFKRREAEGKSQEAFDGGTVTWSGLIDKDDQMIIDRYKRLPQFV